MFSAIANIYNKKTKGPTLMELFTTTGKLKKLFWQLESCYHTRVDVCGNNLNIVSMCAVSPVVHTSLVVKKNQFSCRCEQFH